MFLTSPRVVITTLAFLGSAAVPGLLVAQGSCPPLPPPTGPVIEVQPSQVADLPAIVADAATGTTNPKSQHGTQHDGHPRKHAIRQRG